ncbi:MAG: prepilin-type N-terminal cleavage/methylation domain-containing protein [Alphaproteobacteria bacterium]|nr:prepilin-type N-terminal cleavage/methylation domain-containing protein [Alphaproteobacteria bacterium]
MNKFRKSSKGLILIEVAIAMIIFSLCIGSILMIIQHSQFDQQNSVTHTHHTLILRALNRYHGHMGHLPCPSQPEMDDGFALKKCQGAHEQIGILPYKTLGIPAYVAKDGHGHYFTYAVSEHATVLNPDTDSAAMNNLQVLDISGRRYGSRTNETAYILISHGPKGSGAFSLQASRKRFPTQSEFEAENSRDTLTFYADVPPKDSEHRVFFISRTNLDVPTTPKLLVTEPSLDSQTISEDDPYGMFSSEE